jgi:hypothetical protein
MGSANIPKSEDASVAIVIPAAIATPDIFAWTILPPAQAWKNIVASEELDRPKAYWQAAIALLHAEQGQEATGMLDLLVRKRPDAAMNPNYTLARAQALVLMRRDADGLVAMVRIRRGLQPVSLGDPVGDVVEFSVIGVNGMKPRGE